MNTISGFRNTGSICYFNSLIQSLLSLKSFVNYIVNNSEKNELCKIFNSYINSEEKDIFFTSAVLKELLSQMKTNIDYIGQQSASEFMLLLVDKLGADEIFQIKYVDEITCLECNNVSKKIDISIFHNVYSMGSTNILEDMSYKLEKLNDYKCDKCNKKTNAKKEKFLVKIPDVICFVFINKYTNNFTNISYSNNFKIQDSEEQYNLKATVEHMGSLNSGHYFSRVSRNNEFYIANDNSIQKIGDKIDKLNTSYIIFYEK